jgi:hypothetical protein
MGDQTLRIRMETLVERLQELTSEHDMRNRPDADDAEWHRTQAIAYAEAVELIRTDFGIGRSRGVRYTKRRRNLRTASPRL